MGRPNVARWREDRGTWVSKINGSLVTLARGKKNRAQANRELKRLLAQKKAPAGREIPLWDLADIFLAMVRREKKPLTFEWYTRHLTGFSAHAGEKTPVAEIRPFHLARWLDSHEWGPTTRHGAITAVKRLFNWARKQGYLERDPLADVEKPTPLVRLKIMTAEQARLLYAQADREEVRDFMTALEQTGMRPSEAMRLEAAMIDFEEGTAEVEGKGRLRRVYLNETVLLLFRRLALRWPEGPILRNTRGTPWTRNTTKRWFQRLRKRAGLGAEATAESYRHAFATDGLERGVPIATMAELMGHKSTRMIEKHYSKLRERKDHLREAVKQVRPAKKIT